MSCKVHVPNASHIYNIPFLKKLKFSSVENVSRCGRLSGNPPLWKIAMRHQKLLCRTDQQYDIRRSYRYVLIYSPYCSGRNVCRICGTLALTLLLGARLYVRDLRLITTAPNTANFDEQWKTLLYPLVVVVEPMGVTDTFFCKLQKWPSDYKPVLS